MIAVDTSFPVYARRAEAIHQVEAKRLLTELAQGLATAGRATGNVAHDAHIAALLREHGVREFWPTDKDFHRFPGIAVRNPFTAEGVHETRVKYTARRA